MSDTPETDKERLCCCISACEYRVSADFARRLERERDAYKAQRDRISIELSETQDALALRSQELVVEVDGYEEMKAQRDRLAEAGERIMRAIEACPTSHKPDARAKMDLACLEMHEALAAVKGGQP